MKPPTAVFIKKKNRNNKKIKIKTISLSRETAFPIDKGNFNPTWSKLPNHNGISCKCKPCGFLCQIMQSNKDQADQAYPPKEKEGCNNLLSIRSKIKLPRYIN